MAGFFDSHAPSPLCERTRHDNRLFVTPSTIRVFDAGCQAAGIPKTDERGCVIDIHALRHTFGTHLSALGVHPRTAMAVSRNGDLLGALFHARVPDLAPERRPA